MAENWVTNTIYVSNFVDDRQLYNFFITIRQFPRNEEGEITFGPIRIDLEFLSANVMILPGELRLGLSFLSSGNIAAQHGLVLTDGIFRNVRLDYLVNDPETSQIEILSFRENELDQRLLVSKETDREVLNRLEAIPSEGSVLNLSVDDLDFMEYPEFQIRLTSLSVPPASC